MGKLRIATIGLVSVGLSVMLAAPAGAAEMANKPKAKKCGTQFLSCSPSAGSSTGDPGIDLLSQARDLRRKNAEAVRRRRQPTPPPAPAPAATAVARPSKPQSATASTTAKKPANQAKVINTVNYSGVTAERVAAMVDEGQALRTEIAEINTRLDAEQAAEGGSVTKAEREALMKDAKALEQRLDKVESRMTDARKKFDAAIVKSQKRGVLSASAVQTRDALVHQFDRAWLTAVAAEREFAAALARITKNGEVTETTMVVADRSLPMPVLKDGTQADDTMMTVSGSRPIILLDRLPETTTTTTPAVPVTKPAYEKPVAAYDVNAARAAMQRQTQLVQEVKVASDAETGRILALKSAPPSREAWVNYGAQAAPALRTLQAQDAKFKAITTEMTRLRAEFDANGGEARHGQAFINDAGVAYGSAAQAANAINTLKAEQALTQKMADALRQQGIAVPVR